MACYCAHVRRIDTRTRVVVLQHPRERDKAVGTARIAALCLPHSEIIVGVDFAQSARFSALLADPERPAVLLYPGRDARDVQKEPPTGPVTLVVIDGTWHQARSLVRRNPELARLPCYAFEPARPSEYQIRREPRADYVSTIEALAVTLAALEGTGESFEPLLAPFRAMVSVQVDFASRSVRGRHRQRRREGNLAPARLPELLLDSELVCVTGEANAWPHDRVLQKPPHPHELVHWLGQRMPEHSAGEAAFEALLAPRLPLSKSPAQHAKLDPAELLSGLTLSDFRSAWASFARPTDVLCCWGHYAINLLQREAVQLPARMVDLRKVSGDYLKARPGSLEELVVAQGLPFRALGRGRGGERLGMLVAVSEWLVREARRERAPSESEAQADLGVDQ